jgi:hypothetical protein
LEPFRTGKKIHDVTGREAQLDTKEKFRGMNEVAAEDLMLTLIARKGGIATF